MLPAKQKSVAQKISTVPKSADAIACRVLGKTYDTRTGSPVVAIEDINFTVSAGEFVTVVGPSGCGKSTLLRLLGGLTQKTTGEMELAGSTINGPRRDVGIVFQSPTLLAWRTVHENIILPVDVLNLDRKSHSLRAKQLVAMVGLEGFGLNTRRSFREVCSSALRSVARSFIRQSCCSWTSRLGLSMRSRGKL